MKFAYLIEPPFTFRNADGSVSGCDVEVARHVFSVLGIDSFEPVETAFAELLPGVADGRWRMTTGLFVTEERQAIASFSRPIWALPDGLLVQSGNPLGFTGYRSVADHTAGVLAVIRDQIQHRSAVTFGIPDDRILVFETYTEAAEAVLRGDTAAYASVGRAHSGFIERHPERALTVVTVPASEKAPAFGSFAFAKADDDFRHAVNGVLDRHIGSPKHRAMMARYGFSDEEIDLVAR